LEGPAGGEVKANTARSLANVSADFEQLCAQGFNLCGAPGQGQLQTEKVDQVVSGGVQQQAEGVGQEAVTAQAVGTEAVFELLDAILPTIVAESEDLGSRSVTVGDQETQVGSGIEELPELVEQGHSKTGIAPQLDG
jgi:phage-related minor tail protein